MSLQFREDPGEYGVMKVSAPGMQPTLVPYVGTVHNQPAFLQKMKGIGRDIVARHRDNWFGQLLELEWKWPHAPLVSVVDRHGDVEHFDLA